MAEILRADRRAAQTLLDLIQTARDVYEPLIVLRSTP
jgi:hypothetical protein